MAIINYTENEVDFLARLMRAEAIGEGEHGMLLVGNVVINRVLCKSPDFKYTNTIQLVIFQTPGGFAGVKSELFEASSTDNERVLAMRLINGEKFYPATNALWFYAPNIGEACLDTWFNQKRSGKYKNHCFYVPNNGLCKE